jgi:hypothetical protein
MKFYVLRLVDWPKHIKSFLLRITYTIFSSNLHNKLFFLILISYTVSMVHLSSHLMFPIKYAFLYKTRRQ